MRKAFAALGTGIVVAVALAACGGGSGDAATGPTGPPPSTPTASPTVIGPSFSPTPARPTPTPLPSPSGQGFCTDRSIVGDALALVKRADEPFRQVAAYVLATEDIVRADASSAPSSSGASKIEQLALTLDTLRQAVMGAAANYPDDFAVRSWVASLPGFTAKVAKANACPG